jgi:hypothetical protein
MLDTLSVRYKNAEHVPMSDERYRITTAINILDRYYC